MTASASGGVYREAQSLRLGFTMAEILLSLTIIGVVAAITLPSLTGNINERTWNTQRKALYARFSQAMSLMPNLNGYGKVIAETETESAVDTAAETFVTEGLSKVLKINNICDTEHLADCGIPNKITALDNNVLDNFTTSYNTILKLNNLFPATLDTKAAAFETVNGESILVYYNPKCIPNQNKTTSHDSKTEMCANFIYDLNGNKGPNTVGKDIGFMSAIYAIDPIIVAPQPLSSDASTAYWNNASNMCTKKDKDSRLPNIDELSSMFYNKILIKKDMTWDYWSSSKINSQQAWYLYFYSGYRLPYVYTHAKQIRCIKR